MKKRPKRKEPTLEDIAFMFIIILMMSVTALGVMTILFMSSR